MRPGSFRVSGLLRRGGAAPNVGLEVETAAADQDFAGDVVGERGAEEEDGVGSFFGGAEAAKGAALLEGVEGGGGDADLDVCSSHVEARVGGSCGCDETGFDEAEADGVDVDVVAAPTPCPARVRVRPMMPALAEP